MHCVRHFTRQLTFSCLGAARRHQERSHLVAHDTVGVEPRHQCAHIFPTRYRQPILDRISRINQQSITHQRFVKKCEREMASTYTHRRVCANRGGTRTILWAGVSVSLLTCRAMIAHHRGSNTSSQRKEDLHCSQSLRSRNTRSCCSHSSRLVAIVRPLTARDNIQTKLFPSADDIVIPPFIWSSVKS